MINRVRLKPFCANPHKRTRRARLLRARETPFPLLCMLAEVDDRGRLAYRQGIGQWLLQAPAGSTPTACCGPRSRHRPLRSLGQRGSLSERPLAVHPDASLRPPQPTAVLGFACAPRPSRAFLARAVRRFRQSTEERPFHRNRNPLDCDPCGGAGAVLAGRDRSALYPRILFTALADH